MSVAEAVTSNAVIASAESEPVPLSGQKNRSGPNFILISNNGGTITLNAPTGITFAIMQDRSGLPDKTPVPKGYNGMTINGDVLSTGDNYYIANPEGATQAFIVTLTQ